jgi:hypothetical protein
MNSIIVFPHFASVQSLLRRDKVAVGCAQDDGVHDKDGRMRAESRSVQHPAVVVHGKQRHGCSAKPLFEL